MSALLTDNLPLLAGAPNGIQKLRELILELAVRGKLVPQDPSDEPASELLKRIVEEKARLVAEGKIRKPKPLAEIADEEKPYDLPGNWEWVRLPEIYYPLSVSGNKLLSSQISDEGEFPVVDQGKRFVAGYTDDDSLLIRLPGPVVVFGDHTTERKYVDFDFVAGADGVKILRPVLQDERFFWWQLVGLKLEGRGYARHFKVLNDAFFALPPKSEQSRIVAKVDELMALCDRLEARQADADSAHARLVQVLLDSLTQASDADDFAASWQRLAEHFHSLFTSESSIDALKQTLLQLAVMGKLVPQDPGDEPASELLKRIAEEKARLVAEEGLRTTARDDVPEDERYLAVPRGWAYCRLGNLARFIDYRGKTPTKTQAGIPLITAKNVRPGFISREPQEFIAAVDYEAWMTRGFPRIGDMLFTTEAPMGNVALIDISEKFALAQRVICLQLHELLIGPFLKLAIMSSAFQKKLLGAATGMTATGIKASRLKEIPVPLPPLAEQQRIVVKLDQLMNLCDQLKARLSAARQLHERLTSTLVEQAVA